MLTLFTYLKRNQHHLRFWSSFHEKLIHCALMLVGTFFCLGGIYVMLNAEFVAVIQVLVYAGAIMVLFLFCVDAPFKQRTVPGSSKVGCGQDAGGDHHRGNFHSGCLNLLRQRLDAG